MAFDFPASPSSGQQFTPVVGGPTYVWQSPVWKLASGGISAGVMIADTMPVNPVHGQLWWESDSGNSFIYYDDGTSGQWVQFNVAPPIPPQASPFRRTVVTAVSTTTTFQYDVSTLFADIEVLGGGGSGGASVGPTSGAGLAVAGGGGGGGGYAKKLIQITDAVRAATKTITVGYAGTLGGNGGPSSYGDTVNTLTGNGGIAGGNSSAWLATTTHTYGGLGGTASGGEVNIPGEGGDPGLGFGQTTVGVAGYASAVGGSGGKGALGGSPGRGAAVGTTNSLQSAAGAGAGFPGCGGGGAIGLNAAANPSYGPGGNGLVIITEYR